MCCDDENLSVEDDNQDCYELDTTWEQIYEMDFFEYDIDAYWAKGWSVNDEGFYRDDSDAFNEQPVRVFPTRYRLEDFVFTKSLRRVLKKNLDLKVLIRPFRPTRNKDSLYTAHLHRRFQMEKPRYRLTEKSFEQFQYSHIKVMELGVYDNRRLIAGSIFFVGRQSIVSSLGFWETDEVRRSLGTLTILLEIQYALRRKKKFYYLGNYIRQCPNYHYKTRFAGFELFDWDNNAWVDFKSARIKEMFNHRFRCRDDFERKDPQLAIELFRVVANALPDIAAAALFGSRARQTAHPDSDYNVLLVTNELEEKNERTEFPKRFHRLRETRFEERGEIKIVRAFYKNDDVYEFNYVSPDWAKTDSIKESTRRLIADGIQILYDPQGILENLQKAVSP